MGRCNLVTWPSSARWPGAVAIAAWALHAGVNLSEGRPAELLWACHLASLLAGAGALARRPVLCAVGALWSMIGLAFWGLYLAGGGALEWASLATHAAGLAAGIHGVRRRGMPRRTAWTALVLLAVLQQACRWLTEPADNVNLAFSVHPGWEAFFPSYRIYVLALAAVCGGGMRMAEWLLRARCGTPGALPHTSTMG